MTLYPNWAAYTSLPTLPAATAPASVFPASSRRYRFETPNLVDDMGLSPHAFRLYCHAQRVAGARPGGSCYENTDTLAQKCRMSTGSVSSAKRELVERGLVRIKPGDKRLGTSDVITIVDIWAVNFAHFSAMAAARKNASPLPPAPSPVQNTNAPLHEGVHDVNGGSSYFEAKKEPPSESPQPSIQETTTRTAGVTVQTQNTAVDAAPVVVDSKSKIDENDSELAQAMAHVLGSVEGAVKFIKKCGEAACRQQLDWLPHRKPRNPGAVYADSLRLNYDEPEALKQARKERDEQEAKTARAKLAEARADAEHRDKTAHAAAREAWFASLPPGEQEALDTATELEAAKNRAYACASDRTRAHIRTAAREIVLRDAMFAGFGPMTSKGKNHA